MTKDFSSRRIFLLANGNYYKLFSINQNFNDGSIYVSFRNFPNIKWIGAAENNNELIIQLMDSVQDQGKLSIHASGQTGFKAHSTQGEHKLLIRGNYLLNRKDSKAGMRHLLTIFMDEPECIPISTLVTRKSDFFLNNDKPLKPFCMVLFAIPSVLGIKHINLQGSFQIDDLETIPPEGGFGDIALRHHTVIWFAYRTKFMDKWPAQSIVSYTDGYLVPMFVGKSTSDDTSEFQYELKKPSYEFSEGNVNITF
ncbi:MAG: hypothetical protein HYZ25_11810 [Chloroflexi bacterium]|nr:hypothetical protein [Chloroflexota bacterium]